LTALARPLAAALCAALLACSGQEGAGGAGPKAAAPGAAGGQGGRAAARFPVEVAEVEARRVEYAVTAVGSVEAFERVQVTARVAGVVERVRAREGAAVKAGDVIAEIEPRRYDVAVASARAALERAQASRADAQAALARREAAVEQTPGLIPGEELETSRTRVRVGAAEVAQAQAALDQAELNRRDAYVRAPIAGVIETRTIETGQYVQPGAVLATLVRRDPLLLRFQVPEADATRLRPGMAATFRVRATDAAHQARITHVSQGATGASRMVAIVAEVAPAARERLRPGMFAEVQVPVGGAADAPVIPQLAIRPTERGFVAFVVEGDVARERVLTLGMRTPDGRAEVRSGLKAGERLVVRGAEALRDGAPVRVSGGGAPDAPAGGAPGGAGGGATGAPAGGAPGAAGGGATGVPAGGAPRASAAAAKEAAR
jgi:RND family efflux transporter MFP subunit